MIVHTQNHTQNHNPNHNQNLQKSLIINKIKQMEWSEESEEPFLLNKCDLEYIINQCKSLEENSKNQYFFDIVSNLEYKTLYIVDDIYILNDLEKIKLFLKYRL